MFCVSLPGKHISLVIYSANGKKKTDQSATNMGTANGKRKYRDDPTREVFEAARSGDAVLLNEVLQEMNSSERTSALETKMDASLRYDVNEYETFKVTPLIVAAKNGHADCVKVLLKYKADIECRGGDDDDDVRDVVKYSCRCCTPLFVAATYGHLDVLSCLIANGAEVNTRSKYNCTPLMIASRYGHVNVVTFLINHGPGNIDLKDKNGETALHYAVHRDFHELGNSFVVVHILVSLGASQLCNNQGLTPLLSASNKRNISIVEGFLKMLECTKEQRIDALELLGASLAAAGSDINRGFQYIKHGMQERFADPSHPLLKQPVEPVEAYQNRRESQSLEELAQIEYNRNAIIMESLMITERIIGTHSVELLQQIRMAAKEFRHDGNLLYKELSIHAIQIAQSCNQPCICDLIELTDFLYNSFSFDPPTQKDIFQLLEQTVLECEKQQKLRKGLESQSSEFTFKQWQLFHFTKKLVQTIAKFKLFEAGKSSCLSVPLKRLCCLNP